MVFAVRCPVLVHFGRLENKLTAAGASVMKNYKNCDDAFVVDIALQNVAVGI